MGATASFSHESMPHAAKPAAIKEQKEWGIAGDTKAVTRTITLRMGDDMRFAPSHIDLFFDDTARPGTDTLAQLDALPMSAPGAANARKPATSGHQH